MYLRILFIFIISMMNILKSFQYQVTTQLRMNKQMTLFSNIINSKYKRPSLDDIERISKGLAAKTRGVGSRQVPHRLNTVSENNLRNKINFKNKIHKRSLLISVLTYIIQ